MDKKIEKFFDSVGSFFTGGESIPWCEPDIVANCALGELTCQGISGLSCIFFRSYFLLNHIPVLHIQGCEREVADAEKGSNDKLKSECIMRLSWALVHSKRPEDVQRGIAMLEVSLANSPPQDREKVYLLAVGYFRNGEYSKSRQLVDRCLEIAPDWRQASTLKKAIEDKITKDGVIGIGIAATAVGLVAGGIAAVVSAARKK